MHCNDERTNLTGGQVVDRAQELRGKPSCSCEPDNHDFYVLIMKTMYIQIIISRNSIHNTLYDDNAESRSSHCLETGAETRIAIHTQIYVVYLVIRGCVRNFYLLKILTSAVTDKFVINRVRTSHCPFKCLISKANYFWQVIVRLASIP